jgi:hypothetical protein
VFSTTEEEGCTMTLGIPPVEAAAELGRVEVGCATSGTREETGVFSTTEEEGCTMTLGIPPVETAAEFWAVEVGWTTTEGSVPVELAAGLPIPNEMSTKGAADDRATDEETTVVGAGSGTASGEEVGWTID